jgi:phage FluMu gp28-like protein
MATATYRTPDDVAWKRYRDDLFGQLPTREREAFEAWIRTFYQFQLQWLFEPADYALALKSRQIGFSHTTAALATLWAVAMGETTTLISVGEREAKEVLEKAKAHAGALRDFGSQWATVRGKDAAEEIRFASGGRLVALPQTSGGRSFSGNVFLDEYAYLQSPEQVWDGASAVTMHGYRLRVASTPNGVGNSFHSLATDPKQHAGYAIHTIPIERAIADGMKVDTDRCWKMAKGDPRIYDQLFRCKFLDGNLQYISSASVNECSAADCYTYVGDYYAGLDLGKENDLTVTQSLRTCKRTDTDALRDLVGESWQRYQWRRLAVDATGIGAFPAEQLQKTYGSHRVEAVTFTQNSKEDLATTMHAYFTAGGVKLPLTDAAIADIDPGGAEALREDVCAIRRIVTSAGNVRYDAPRNSNGHADRAWALALALHAVKQPGSSKSVQ